MLKFSDQFVLGTWGLCGSVEEPGMPRSYGFISDKTFYDVCSYSLKRGIRWFDIASTYGNSGCLSRLGAIKNKGDDIAIALKVGRPYVSGRFESQASFCSIMREYDSCVEQMGFEPNAVIIKDPDYEVLRSARIIDLLDKLENRLGGKQVGLSTHFVTEDIQFSSTKSQRILEIEYNGLNYRSALRQCIIAKRAGWVTWGVQPLAYGFLADKKSCDDFRKDDFRRYLECDVTRGLEALSDFFHRSIPKINNFTRAQHAIAFCILTKHLDIVVIGPRSVDQLKNSLGSLNLAENQKFSNYVIEFLDSEYQNAG